MVVSPRLVDVVDVHGAWRRQSSGATQQLDECHLQQWGLSLACPTPEDPTHEAEITWLLPSLGLRLTRYRLRQRHAQREPSRLTAVQIECDSRSWCTTDLFLGLQVPDHGCPRIIQSEEFATAVSAGLLRPAEAEYALEVVHRTLEELSLHRDLNRWLAHQGIFDLW